MKKFFLALCAIIMGMAANAADYYLVGGFNNWTTADPACLFTAAEDGTYVLDYEGTLTSDFKINDGTWDNDKANFGSNGSTLKLGEPYTMKVGGNPGNIAIESSVANPHLVLNVNDPSNPVLTITSTEAPVESVITYAIHGQIFDGQNWNSTEMTEAADGTWTLTADIVAGEFGIKKLDNGKQIAWFAADGAAAVSVNTALPAKVGGSNWSSTLEGEYTFVFDPAAMTLTIKGGEAPVDPDPVDPVDPVYSYGIHGSVFTGSWETREMTEAEDGTWTLTATLVAGEFGIMPLKDGQQDNYRWIAADGETTVSINTPMAAKENGSNWSSTLEGQYTFVFDPAAMTLTIVGEETPVDPDPVDPDPVDPVYSYAIHGSVFTGSWESRGMDKGENGTWILTATLQAGEFGIQKLDADGKQAEWISAQSGYPEAVVGIAMTAATKNITNWVSTLEGEYTFVFDPTAMTLTIKGDAPVDPDPVEPDPVDPVYSYGLHGSVFTGSWETREMTEAEDGTWTLTATLQAGEFGIMPLKDGKQDNNGWIAAANGMTEAVVGIAMTATSENSSNWVSTLEGEYTFVFNPEAMTLTIQGETPVDPDPVDPDPEEPVLPEHVYIIGNLASGNWATATAPELTFAEDTKLFTIENVEIKASSDDATTGYFTFITVQGSDWDTEVNNGDRYGAPTKDAELSVPSTTEVTLFKAGVNASSAYSWKVEAGCYDIVLDLTNMTIAISSADTPVDPDPVVPDPEEPVLPEHVYIVGTLGSGEWDTANAPEVARIEGTNTFKIENVQIVAASADTSMGYFSFITKQGADWDAVNGGDRYGASSKDEAISVPGTASMTKYAVGVNASAAESWMVEAEYYDITLDFDNMTVNVIKSFESNLSIDTEENESTYYNMEGVQVENPVSGLYIEVRGNQVRKVMIK